ncbi:OLC1v1034540C1 [Oldenlandia corymbosa var. corymbosa]|uniref:OLC1v1034540C1 n=1 Tax=Oldenlandia corymbosa var. corymbosa TaxID=529605 RepID=A0AAV1CRM7_OLDCO|nr:OLC1v1034540C1 [Oldenlandia corymbosa var. corymbosa]
MSHHRHPPQPPPPPPPLPINHQSAAQIFTKTARFFISHPLTLVFIVSLVFTFRYNVENGADYLISFVDGDPSLKSLISRLDLSGHHHYQQHRHQLHVRRRRRAFLHLSRVGTLDEDFFSGDADYERSLFHPTTKSQPNGTYLFLSNFNFSSGFATDPDIDNGVSFPKTIRSGVVSFKPPPEPVETRQEFVQSDENVTDDDSNSVVDLQFLLRGLELGRRDTTALLYFIGILSAAYGYVILAFLVTYTWVNGIVFYRVLNDLLGKPKNIFRAVWDGSNLGLRRLSGFVLMRWAVRDALAQLMGIYFFGEIDDQYRFFKIFMRMKLMPFSDTLPWVMGYEKESFGFVASWFFVELVVSFMFAVDTWVAIVDSRKSGKEVVKEGCHLLATLLQPAVEIKCWELIVCGWPLRWLLSVMVGEMFALLFQSVMEVHFMVAWLLFYLAARHKDATLSGREFGQRELEVFLEGAR